MELEQFMIFLNTYGWQLAIIAFVGCVILGVLKYANVFSKIEKNARKPIYFGISMGFSLVTTIIYLAIIGQFDIGYIVAVTSAMYAMNQTMYSFYETTTLRELVNRVLNSIFKKDKKAE